MNKTKLLPVVYKLSKKHEYGDFLQGSQLAAYPLIQFRNGIVIAYIKKSQLAEAGTVCLIKKGDHYVAATEYEDLYLHEGLSGHKEQLKRLLEPFELVDAESEEIKKAIALLEGKGYKVTNKG